VSENVLTVGCMVIQFLTSTILTGLRNARKLFGGDILYKEFGGTNLRQPLKAET